MRSGQSDAAASARCIIAAKSIWGDRTMGYAVNARGAVFKLRSPWAAVGLGITPAWFVWWFYRINREMKEYGLLVGDETLANSSPERSLLAVTLGAVLVVPAVVSILNTVKRIQRVEQLAGREPLSLRLAVVLLILSLVFIGWPALIYLEQKHLNGVWERYPAPLPARIHRIVDATARSWDESREDAERLARRVEALEKIASARGHAWPAGSWARGCWKWRTDQLAKWHIPRGGWKSVAFAPIIIIASVAAATLRLARWEELHAEDGYAEPPGNLLRCVRLWRQARWGPTATFFMAAFAAAITYGFVLTPPVDMLPMREIKTGALAAGTWLIVLAMTGELPSAVRGPVRAGVWVVEFVLWIGFDQTGVPGDGIIVHGSAGAIIEGIRLSAIADLIGLALIGLLLWARDWPLRAQGNEIEMRTTHLANATVNGRESGPDRSPRRDPVTAFATLGRRARRFRQL